MAADEALRLRTFATSIYRSILVTKLYQPNYCFSKLLSIHSNALGDASQADATDAACISASPDLLWEEHFIHTGNTAGLDESNWSFHIGDGTAYGIPGRFPDLSAFLSLVEESFPCLDRF